MSSRRAAHVRIDALDIAVIVTLVTSRSRRGSRHGCARKCGQAPCRRCDPRARETDLDRGQDRPGARAEDEDAVGKVDGLVDVVGDVDDRDGRPPRVAWTRRRTSWSSARVCASTEANGSSMRRAAGRETSARAIATRCCIPPESSQGYLSATAWSPSRRGPPQRGRAVSDPRHPAPRSGNATFG